MDISAETVLAGPNLIGGMDPGMNTNIQTEYMKSKYMFVFPLGTFNCSPVT